MAKVLVACLENWDTLQEVPFVLKNGGYTVDVFCSKNSWLICNSYFDKWIECSSDIEEYKRQLVAVAKDTTYDKIVLGDEKLLKLMNDFVADDETLFTRILPLTKIENRAILASKAGMSSLCEKYNILSPKYLVYNETDFEEKCKTLIYPVLLKLDLSWGGGGILQCANAKELHDNLQKMDIKENLIAQEFITGEDIGVEAFYNNGELLNYNASEVVQYFKDRFSFTTKRNYFNSKKLEDLLTVLGRNMGFNGFASIQYVYKPSTDSYYLIETDLRPNFWLPYGRFTGKDFSVAINKMLYPNNNKTATIHPENVKTEVAIFYRDMIRCVKNKDLKGIGKWLFNAKGYWKFIPTYDKVLFKKLLHELFIAKVIKKITMKGT